MDRIALDLGFIQIYWYSIMIFLGVISATFLILREGKKQNINENLIINMIFYGVITGLIGARLYYVLFNLDYYTKYPLEIFEVWNGGLAIHGGLIFGLITVIIYCKKYDLKLFKITDIVAPGLLLAQAIGRWGNFFNQEAYGQITSSESLNFLPGFIKEGMYINGNYYQPTFLYESIWNLLGFIAIIILRKKDKYLKNGQLTGFYLMWYSFGRFFIEIFRSDSLYLGPIKIAQLVSVILFIIGTIMFIFLRRGPKFKNFYNIEEKDVKY